MLGLLVQNQSHRAGTHLRGKLLRRIAHQTFFSGEMVSANPGAVHNDPPMVANRAPSSKWPKAAKDVFEAAAALPSAASLTVCTVLSRVCFSFASASSNCLRA